MPVPIIERRTQNWKTGPVELRADDPGGDTLCGYAAVFNRYSQDMGGWVETIAPGAFAKTISDQRDIYALFNHDPNAILGLNSARTLMLTEDEVGLRYEIKLDSDHWGNTVRSKVARGELRGSSFGFSVVADTGVEWGLTEQGMPMRTVRAAKLYDVGPVTYPAYLSTRDAGAAVALRSLAAATGVDVDELVDAAGRRELRSYIGSDGPIVPEPAQPATPLALAQRRLELMRLQAPSAGR